MSFIAGYEHCAHSLGNSVELAVSFVGYRILTKDNRQLPDKCRTIFLFGKPIFLQMVNKKVNKILDLLTFFWVFSVWAYACKSLYYKHLREVLDSEDRSSPGLLTTGSVVRTRAGELSKKARPQGWAFCICRYMRVRRVRPADQREEKGPRMAPKGSNPGPE
jgi:hypothetical protein